MRLSRAIIRRYYYQKAGVVQLNQNQSKILLSTRDTIAGYRIVEELGLVAGSSVQARSFFHDLWSRVRGFLGGEVKFYSQLVIQTSADATKRMMKEAESKGANAVVQIRLENSSTSDPTAGVFVYSMAYGTAVKIVPEETNENIKPTKLDSVQPPSTSPQ